MDYRAGDGLPTKRNVSERLIKERSKALEILHTQSDNKPEGNESQKGNGSKPKKGSFKPSTKSSGSSNDKTSPINKENMWQSTKIPQPKNLEKFLPKKSASKVYLEPKCSPSKLNGTDYVLYRNREKIDISDLVLDASLTLESTPITIQKCINKGVEISFNSNEITGRSTLENCNAREPRPSIQVSVHDILATSISQKARDLRESLAISSDGFNRPSMASSCISGFSDMQKNPHLTHMSGNKSSMTQNSKVSLDEGNNLSALGFSFGDASTYTVASENFAPAEMMESRLLEGEVSWAQKFATIPTRVLSKEAKNRLPIRSDYDSINVSTQSHSNDSLGNFFQTRANNIESMIEAESPAKRTAPICLISDDTVTTTMTNSRDLTLGNIESTTPRVDNNTYNNLKGNCSIAKLIANKCLDTHDSKDSGNSTGKSDSCILSVIERALENLNMAQIESTNETSKNLWRDSTMANNSKAPRMGLNQSSDFVKRVEQLSDIAEIILENKENIDMSDGCKDGNTNDKSDTHSFTDSLLNTSIQNYRMSSAGQTRSPLSPIPIIITEPLPDTSDHDGDTELFENSPPILSNRQKRLTKSPRTSPSKFMASAYNESKNETRTPMECLVPNDEMAKNPIPGASTVTSVATADAARTKSLSSTRLEGERNSPNDNRAIISPNFNKFSKTLTPTQYGDSNASNSFDLSPLSSPRSCFSSSANSPMGSTRNGNTNRAKCNNCHCSPRFDSTTNSEQRYLNSIGNSNTGGLRRIASSPSGVNTNAAVCASKHDNAYNFGVPPMRTCSSSSVQSTESTSTRSASRCSYNSEFSHRDGKVIPLKATTLELSWGSVKLRNSSQKSLQIKNTFSKRLVVRIQIYGPGFELSSPKNHMLTLQSQECRTIAINFYPTVIGAATGKLVFQSPKKFNVSTASTVSNSNLSTDIIIPLYAYGGHASISIQNILKGPVGAPFLPMGELCGLFQPLERTFQIYNKGPLVGFAVVCIEPISLHAPGLSSAFKVFPQCTLMEPQSVVTIRLVFEPTREDVKNIKKIMHDVVTLAKLRIIYGDEPMRQRLRQIHRDVPEDTRERLFIKSFDKIWTRFPGERPMFQSETFKENATLAQDMWTSLSEQEITLTLQNNSLDETSAELSTIFTETDNTILFQTMYAVSPTNQLETVEELLEENTISNTSTHKETLTADTWSVSPDYLEFDLNRRESGEPESCFLVVSNNFSVRQYFQVSCNYPDVLCFMPNDGYVEPKGGVTAIRVYVYAAAQMQRLQKNIVITVQMDKEKVSVPVYVSSRSHAVARK